MAANINKEKEEMRTQEFFLKKIIKGGGLFFFGLALSKILTYLYRIVIARVDPQSYGQFSIGFALMGFLGVIIFLGLDSGIARFIPFYLGKKKNKELSATLGTGLFIPLLMSIFLGIIIYSYSNFISTYFFHNTALIPILKLFALSMPILIANRFFVIALQSFQDAKYVTWLKYVFENLAKVFLTISFIKIWRNAYGITIGFSASILLTTIILIIVFSKFFFKIKNFSLKDKKVIGNIFGYSIPLMFAGLLDMIIEWTDSLMIGHFHTDVLVGIYNAAIPTAFLLLIIPQSLLYLFFPVVTQLYAKKDILSVRYLYNNLSRWAYFLNFPLFLSIFIFSKQILNVLFGKEYTAGAIALSILSIGLFIFSMTIKDLSLIRMLQNSKTILLISTSAAIINIILNWLFIPAFSIIGAAVATSVSFSFSSIIYLALAYKKFKIIPFSKDYIKATISTIISIFIAYKIDNILFKTTTRYAILMDILIMSIIYLLLLILFKTFNSEDKKIILDARKKLKL